MIKINKIVLSILIIAILFSLGCSRKTVKLGEQTWKSENLNVEFYRNGDIIPQVQDPAQWSKLTTGAWCYNDNNSENGKTHGKIYNWYAVKDLRGLAPEGWHIPSDEEWTRLTKYLGGTDITLGKLKSTTFNENPNIEALNKFKFSSLSGGTRSQNGNFTKIGKVSCFWTSSDDYSYYAWQRDLNNNDSVVYRFYGYKENGMSVLCVKD